jgi:dUTP pyrophosphatase
MLKIKITVKKDALLPEYQTNGAAGADIFALLESDVILDPGKTYLVPTGLFMEIPEGYEAQIRPRSGLALKHGITLLNSPGTIDSDYRGEIKIIVTNLGSVPFIITSGMRIAQIVFNKVYTGQFIKTEVLTDTERKDGGFGHSGV